CRGTPEGIYGLLFRLDTPVSVVLRRFVTPGQPQRGRAPHLLGNQVIFSWHDACSTSAVRINRERFYKRVYGFLSLAHSSHRRERRFRWSAPNGTASFLSIHLGTIPPLTPEPGSPLALCLMGSGKRLTGFPSWDTW